MITAGIPFEQYKQIPKMNPSTIVAGRVSMLALKDSIDNPREETDAMRFGTGFHALLLTPKEFEGKYCVEPDWANHPDNKTKDGKQSTRRTSFVEEMEAKFRETENRTPISQSNYYMYRAMIRSLHSKPYIRELFESAHDNREVTLEGIVEGVEFKGRVDMLCSTCIPDVKTSRTVEERKIFYAFDDLGYHHKMSIYQDLVRQSLGSHRPCKYIVVENHRPFDCVLVNIPDFYLAKKLQEVKEIVRQYKQCLESDVWPGVDGGHGEQEMFIPPREVDEAVEFASVGTSEEESPF